MLYAEPCDNEKRDTLSRLAWTLRFDSICIMNTLLQMNVIDVEEQKTLTKYICQHWNVIIIDNFNTLYGRK